MDGKTKGQRGEVSCLRTHSKLELALNPGLSDPEAKVLHHSFLMNFGFFFTVEEGRKEKFRRRTLTLIST